jgi:hypothetical protein
VCLFCVCLCVCAVGVLPWMKAKAKTSLGSAGMASYYKHQEDKYEQYQEGGGLYRGTGLRHKLLSGRHPNAVVWCVWCRRLARLRGVKSVIVAKHYNKVTHTRIYLLLLCSPPIRNNDCPSL